MLFTNSINQNREKTKNFSDPPDADLMAGVPAVNRYPACLWPLHTG
jgi:hypothetical protein